jgi:hypothetical protein
LVGLSTALMSLHLTAHAYRPFDSTDADVVKPGIVEVELGPLSYLHGEVRSRVMPDLTLNVGLARDWEQCSKVLA